MSETKIKLICYYEDVLDVAQVWPDGDEPPDIDAMKVREVMNHCGEPGSIAREWDLPLTWHIEVTEEEELRSWAQWRCNFLGGELEDKRSEVLTLRKALQERDAQLAAAHEDLAEAQARIEALEADLAARRLDYDLIREEVHLSKLRTIGANPLGNEWMREWEGRVERYVGDYDEWENVTLEQLEHALGVLICAYWIAKDGGE